MSIEIGKTLGPYEIESSIGAGGMGEVWRAKDQRLDRIVAIKVLPARLAGDPDLRMRFEREAKAISSLNHPNICTLYDVGHENGTDYLVMEYIEGESLADRLSKGPLSPKELFETATDIVDALDKAHRQGLIHRDLKPGNVMLTKEGAKLLDFGLARFENGDGPTGMAQAVTRTTPLTSQGSIIGTLQYMSPEQLEGKEADARSDIFAFGALLYEMATGRRAFQGSSQASLIAAVMEHEPAPISAVNPVSPPAFDRLVRKCLAKDPDNRWQSARDLADELRWIQQSGSQAGVPLKLSVRRRLHLRAAWVATAVMTVVATAFAVLWFTRPVPELKVSRFSFEPSGKGLSVQWPNISPDGKLLAFLGTDSLGHSQIWIRPLNSTEAYPLAGTENAWRPFWSPDSRYLAFTVNRGQLKKIPVAGGPAQLIGETPSIADGTWGADGVILLDGASTDSIRQVSASGGKFTAATRIDHDAHETFHAWPSFLPDGRHFLFLSYGSIDGAGSGRAMLSIGSLDSDEVKHLFPVDSRVQYTRSGYIIYVVDQVLLAQRFDPDALEVRGEPMPAAERVGFSAISLANFSVSDEGTLAFQNGVDMDNSRLAWVNRQGVEMDSVGSLSPYGSIELSPDGDRVLYDLFDPDQNTSDIWVRDLRRNVASRLTFDKEDEIWPLWSPNGSTIYYAMQKDGRYQIMRKPSNGTGVPEPVLKSDSVNLGPSGFSRDGSRLIFTIGGADWSIGSRGMHGSDTAIEYLCATPFSERSGSISPNGQYLVYSSNESGRTEVYVRDLSESGGKWQVSTDGGGIPRWRADGRELYYVARGGDMMAVPVSTEREFEIGQPVRLFNQRLVMATLIQRPYDVSADGQKFLLNEATVAESSDFNIVLNWQAELEHR